MLPRIEANKPLSLPAILSVPLGAGAALSPVLSMVVAVVLNRFGEQASVVGFWTTLCVGVVLLGGAGLSLTLANAQLRRGEARGTGFVIAGVLFCIMGIAGYVLMGGVVFFFTNHSLKF